MDETNIISVIQEISPDTDVDTQSVEEAMLEAIYECSPKARSTCVGETPEFCAGVLNALYLHKTGMLNLTH